MGKDIKGHRQEEDLGGGHGQGHQRTQTGGGPWRRAWARTSKDTDRRRTLEEGMGKDIKGHRQEEDLGGGQVAAVEGHSLETNGTQFVIH